mgnify:CR=1 FL=1
MVSAHPAWKDGALTFNLRRRRFLWKPPWKQSPAGGRPLSSPHQDGGRPQNAPDLSRRNLNASRRNGSLSTNECTGRHDRRHVDMITPKTQWLSPLVRYAAKRVRVHVSRCTCPGIYPASGEPWIPRSSACVDGLSRGPYNTWGIRTRSARHTRNRRWM